MKRRKQKRMSGHRRQKRRDKKVNSYRMARGGIRM